MNRDNVLPADFDGVFRFTNFTKDEFKAKWGKIEYTFPPMSTSPLIIPGATPEEVQHIRKKFARELAEKEFFNSKEMERLEKMNPKGQTVFQAAVTYTDNDLTPLIQRCLEPLPIASAKARVLPKTFDENSLRKDEEGNPVTQVLDKKKSLLAQGSGVITE